MLVEASPSDLLHGKLKSSWYGLIISVGGSREPLTCEDIMRLTSLYCLKFNTYVYTMNTNMTASKQVLIQKLFKGDVRWGGC